jgi:hypothetical protein
VKLRGPLNYAAGALIGISLYAIIIIITSVAKRPFDVGNFSEVLTAIFAFVAIVVSAAGIAVTLLLAIVAIWSDDIKAQLRAPKLRLVFGPPEWTLLKNDPRWPAIYWHTDVINDTPSMVAHNVELMVIQCSIIKSNGEHYDSPLPDPLPIQARRDRHGAVDISGKKVTYDTFKCLKAELRMDLLLNGKVPFNFKHQLFPGDKMVVALQAIGSNAVSGILRFVVEWDGHFVAEDEKERVDEFFRIRVSHEELSDRSSTWSSLREFGRRMARSSSRH